MADREFSDETNELLGLNESTGRRSQLHGEQFAAQEHKMFGIRVPSDDEVNDLRSDFGAYSRKGDQANAFSVTGGVHRNELSINDQRIPAERVEQGYKGQGVNDPPNFATDFRIPMETGDEFHLSLRNPEDPDKTGLGADFQTPMANWTHYPARRDPETKQISSSDRWTSSALGSPSELVNRMSAVQRSRDAGKFMMGRTEYDEADLPAQDWPEEAKEIKNVPGDGTGYRASYAIGRDTHEGLHKDDPLFGTKRDDR